MRRGAGVMLGGSDTCNIPYHAPHGHPLTGALGEVPDLARALDAAASEAALALLGQPSHRTPSQWRWGRHGSLSLEIAGTKRGRWCDHESGHGGDMLALAQRHHHGDMRAAIKWARHFLRAAVCARHAQDCTRKPAGAARPVLARCRLQAIEADPDPSRTTLARRLWREAVPIAGTIAETYLREARCIRLPAWPADLRFHPCCPRGSHRLPAMLAIMRHPATGKALGLHRTFLAGDGADRLRDPMGKAMLGHAGVVMLSPFAEVTQGLHIAEGVETALSALTIGLQPAWAAASARGIARFPVLAGIDCLTILADADDAGLQAAATCAARWRATGPEVRVLAPTCAGADINDIARQVGT
jgi:putative DNA primase/helicase